MGWLLPGTLLISSFSDPGRLLDASSKKDFVGRRRVACTMQQDGRQIASVSSGGMCGIFFLDGRSCDGTGTGMKEFLEHVRHLVSKTSEKYPRSMSVFVLYVPAFCDRRKGFKPQFVKEMTQMYRDNFWLTHTLELLSEPFVLLYKLYVGAPEQKTVGLSTTRPISLKTSSAFVGWQKSPAAQVRFLGFRGGYTGLLLLWNGVPPRDSDLDGQTAEVTNWCESLVKDKVRNLAFLCCLNGSEHRVCHGGTGRQGQRSPVTFVTDSGAIFPVVRGVMVYPELLERKPIPERDRVAACLDFRKGVEVVHRAARPQTHSEWLLDKLKTVWRLNYVEIMGELTTPKVEQFVNKFQDRVFKLPGMSYELACVCIVSFPVRMLGADDKRERCFASVEDVEKWLEAQPRVRVHWPWMKDMRGMICLASTKVLQDAAGASVLDDRDRGLLEPLPLRTPTAVAGESDMGTTIPIASEVTPNPCENAMECVLKANALAVQEKSHRKKVEKDILQEKRGVIVKRLNEKQVQMGLVKTLSTQLWPRT